MIAGGYCKANAIMWGAPIWPPTPPPPRPPPAKPGRRPTPPALVAPRRKPWRASTPALRSGRKVAQDAARAAALRNDAVLVDRAYTVDPHAVHADARRVQPRRPRRQIVDATLLAARDGGRIEQQEVGPRAGHEPA